MLQARATIDTSEVLAVLEPRDRATAVRDAFKRTGVTLVARVSRSIRETIDLPAREVKAQMQVYQPTLSNPELAITVRRKKMALSEFLKERQKRGLLARPSKPFNLRIRKRREPDQLRHVFVGSTMSGHIGIFERKGKKRFPIREKFGPTIIGVLVNEEEGGGSTILEGSVKDAAEIGQKNLASQVQRFLDKYSKAAANG